MRIRSRFPVVRFFVGAIVLALMVAGLFYYLDGKSLSWTHLALLFVGSIALDSLDWLMFGYT